MLAYLHIPKTAGTSVRIMFRDAGLPYFEINDLAGAQEFVLMPRWRRQRYRAVFGHMPYGVHRYEPSARYATFLRNPIERVISSFLYVQRVADHPLHERAKSGELTFEHFVRTWQSEDNGQTRQLANYLLLDPAWWERFDSGALESRRLDEAKATLDACEFVGLLENFDTDAPAFGRMFDVPLPDDLYRLNVNGSTLPIDARMRSLLEQRNTLDFELYEYARKLARGG
jgi:hypothetical protein